VAERELLVRIIGDDRDLQRALRNTERGVARVDDRTASFGRNIGRAFAAAGVTVALSEGIRLADQYIDAATNLQEQQSRATQIFDESAASINRWSEGLASSFGIAQAQALEFAGTFGLLFRNTGSTAEEAERFSTQLVELAADLASFNNTNVDDALNSLRSGLTGEIEPLRRFGVFLSEARTQQRALADSGKGTVDALTNQEKVLARLELIMQDTTRAQGDFERTSDGLANKQRIAAAEAANLATSIGKGLAPAMEIATIAAIGLTGGLNDLIDGMGDLEGAIKGGDFFDGFNSAIEEANDRATGFFQNLRDNIPLLDRVADLRNRVVGGAGFDTGGILPGVGGSQRAAARGQRAAQAAKEEVQAVVEAERDVRRSQKQFDELIKGLGLKLDKARITENVADDVAVLREIERAILRRIEREGKTFKLVDQLTQVRLQIASTTRDDAEEAKDAGQDAYDATLDALELNVERAQDTAGLADDQKALRALEKRILARIESEGRTTELLRQLGQVRQQQAEVARQLVEQRRGRREQNQFEALGLTEEGDRPTPGGGSLLRRANNLEKRIKGTVLDTQRNKQILNRIQRVLSGDFGKVGKNVREAILQMLNDISSAFEEGEKKEGPLTRSSGLNTRKILAGLGLSEEEVRELRGRLSSINSSGQQLAALGSAPGGRFQGRPGTGGGPPIVVQSTTTINLDGKQIAKVTTKEQQKGRKRNPPQKRGPNRR
jgi:hypothetical protein